MEKEKNKTEQKKEESSIEELKKKLQEFEKQKCEYLACWQREKADFLNYKKEEMERVGEFLKYANEAFILKILMILDNFELAARQNFPSENLSGQEKEQLKKVMDGFLQIKKQIQDFLKSQGVEEVKTIGEIFNPNLHEAVEDVSSEVLAKEGKKIDSGVIIEEIQKGYKINGRLLRPAKVKVTK